jgi:flavin-dependent dehydrogenase
VPAFDFDVAIVGAGPSGATTALSLLSTSPGLRGRVVLLDRARFPRDKPCAGALGARGDKLLLGLGAVIDVPSAKVDGMALLGAGGEAVASPGNIGRVVRRFEFDHALAQLAVSRGAELRDGVRVDDLHDEGDGGVTLQTSQGPLRPRVVVGCDGVGSLVRKKLGQPPGRLRAQVVEVDTEAAASDRDRSFLVFDVRDPTLPGYAWDFPTIVDGKPLVCRGLYRLKVHPEGGGAAAHEDPVDVAEKLDARLRAQGLDPSRCKNKRYAERGFEAVTRVARGSILLAGEAAGIDPVTGEGIAQAIEYGVLAGRFVAEALSRAASAPGSRVSVEGWGGALARSRLARDLRIRARFVELFYGAARADVERFLFESPDAMHVGCQHFADQPYDWLRLANVLVLGGAHMAALRLAAALGGR